MSELLFRQDAYQQEAEAEVIAHTAEGGVILDRTIFYATGGGQPGDSGWLIWPGGRLTIATAVKAEAGQVALVPAEPQTLPPLGTRVMQRLDWDRRYRHMRMHSALHLLSVVIPLPVTGGQIGAQRGRLDFNMPDAPKDLGQIEAQLNALIDLDLQVSESWITEAELEANPGLIKTMSVRPPMGQGRVRLVRIGTADKQIDLQPCGGTHIARTGEIGHVVIEKVENKGKMNRRITIAFADEA